MMIIKAFAGNSTWELHEGRNVTFLGHNSRIAVPTGDYHYSEDERFPWADYRHVHTIFDTDPEGEEREEYLVKWVRWEDEAGRYHILITDGPVYICNEKGDTVEKLR